MMGSNLPNFWDQIPQAHRFDDSMNFLANSQLAKHAQVWEGKEVEPKLD
jgi:hypothetical protein